MVMEDKKLLRCLDSSNLNNNQKNKLNNILSDIESGDILYDAVQEIYRSDGSVDKGYLIGSWLIGKFNCPVSKKETFAVYREWVYKEDWIKEVEDNSKFNKIMEELGLIY